MIGFVKLRYTNHSESVSIEKVEVRGMRRYRTAELARKRLAEGAYKTRGLQSYRQKQKVLFVLLLLACFIVMMSNMYHVLEVHKDSAIKAVTLVQEGQLTPIKNATEETIFVMAVENLDRTFNPYFAHEDGDQLITQIIYEPLVKYNSVGELEFVLAQSVEYSSDRLSVTMQLKDDIQFSDGTPVTIQDVVNSYLLAIVSDKTGTGKLKGAVAFRADRTQFPEGITIVDDKTIMLTFESYDILNYHLLDVLIYQSADVDFALETGFIKHVKETLVDSVGTGKFMVSDLHATPVVLTENPYYTHGERLSDVEQIQVYEDTDKQVQALIEDNKVDFVAFSWDSNLVNHVFTNHIYDIYGKETQFVLGLAKSRNSEIMENQSIREAISKAIARADILSERYKPRLKAVSSLIPSNYLTTKGYINDIVGHGDAAIEVYQEVLEELQVEEIVLEFPIVEDNYMYEFIGRLVKIQLEAVGYNVHLETLDHGAYLEQVFYNGNYDIVLARENLEDTLKNHTAFAEKYFLNDLSILDDVYKEIIMADTEAAKIEGYRTLNTLLEQNTGFIPIAREQTFQAVSTYWNKRLKLLS